jgi:hypothetical protein
MRKISLLLIGLFIAALTFLSLTTYFYNGFYEGSPVNLPDIDSISAPVNPEGTQPIAGEVSSARIVFDGAHQNAFSADEISSLIEALNNLGADYEIVESPEDFLISLKYANSLVVISPATAYSKEETMAVKDFLRKGGRIVLIYDPTRGGSINSLSTQLEIFFEPDYLYNMNDNAGNYRNIFVDDFKSSSLTSGIKRITLFTASTIASKGGIAFTGAGTTSSSLGEGSYSPIALLDDSIFAVSDQSFMEYPNDRVTDNNRLIRNIAGFLGAEKRIYALEDFPYFYTDATIRYSNESLIELALSCKRIFVDADIDSKISQEPSDQTVYIGLLNDSGKELDKLKDLIYNNTLVSGDLKYDLNRTALIYLMGKGLWILSNEKDPLKDLVDILSTGEVKYYLLSGNLAVLPFEPTVIAEPKEDETALNESVINGEEENQIDFF